MKKGISLIVLVITIIVMIILAAAIIISISNSNVINKAGQAVKDTDLATVKDAASLKYGDAKFNKVSEYTTADYIETKLIEDGVIDEANPYVFTNQGGAFLIPEYDTTSNTKGDYRVINNQLYYFGTDINKRIALKNHENVNTDYITIGFTFPIQGIPKLGDLTGYDKVKSIKYVTKDKTDLTTVTTDTLITTGAELYMQSNYTEKLATVIYYFDFNGTVNLNFSDAVYASLYFYSTNSQTFYDTVFDTTKISYENYEKLRNIFFDVDLNGKVDYVDTAILKYCMELGTSYPGPYSKAIKDMGFYETPDPIFEYVADEWSSYEEYQEYITYTTQDNLEKTARNNEKKAYLEKTYDVNMLISSLPIKVKIFK